MSGGIRAAEIFLQRQSRVSAVFVGADRLALGFIHGLLEGGVRVPEDVAVVGYGDTHQTTIGGLPLTTVDVPKRQVGERAVEILFSRIGAESGNGELQQILLAPSLIIRKSCGTQGD